MIKIALIGYGNLGKACERIAESSGGFEVVGIFTRRNPTELKSPFGTPVYRQDDIFDFKDQIDVACICTGSKSDITELAKKLAVHFNTIDSFDTHVRIPEYFAQMDEIARANEKLSFISIGWDPGLFSLMRALFSGILPNGSGYTFWGRGVSQGHSEALRHIEGVKLAKQYTVPKPEAIERARRGERGLTERDMHLRECYIVCEDGADKEKIRQEIVNMPAYFAPYDTTVNFISEEEFKREHGGMPHAGFVLRKGLVSDFGCNLEFSLKLESNPDFTAAVLLAYSKALVKMYEKGERGCKTVLDVPISELLSESEAEAVKKFV